MTCRHCSAPETIRAHLIPKCFATEVNVGQAHAAQVVGKNDFRPSQSGLWERDLLCGPCDKRLGRLEESAHAALARVRHEVSSRRLSSIHLTIRPFDGDRFLRFSAGLLWKYSITKRFGAIELGRFQRPLERMAFGEGKAIPPTIDGFFVRLIRYPGDSDVFAYRAPLPDVHNGVKFMRFMVGGCVVFVRLGGTSYEDWITEGAWLRGANAARVPVAPAHAFEEFLKCRNLTEGEGRLSEFLDRHGRDGD